jgi:Adenylosuccinate synthase
MDRGKQILFEGAQGTFLDIDHGTYPMYFLKHDSGRRVHRHGRATASDGSCRRRDEGLLDASRGRRIAYGGRAIGADASQSRPRIRRDNGRKRRCGWFDAVAARYAGMINGIDEIAITNLDGLDQVDPIRICVGYQLSENGWMFRRVTQLNSRIASRSTKKSLAGTRLYTLHANFRSFLRPRENMSDTSPNWPVQNSMVSVGPARGETIIL